MRVLSLSYACTRSYAVSLALSLSLRPLSPSYTLVFMACYLSLARSGSPFLCPYVCVFMFLSLSLARSCSQTDLTPVPAHVYTHIKLNTYTHVHTHTTTHVHADSLSLHIYHTHTVRIQARKRKLIVATKLESHRLPRIAAHFVHWRNWARAVMHEW